MAERVDISLRSAVYRADPAPQITVAVACFAFAVTFAGVAGWSVTPFTVDQVLHGRADSFPLVFEVVAAIGFLIGALLKLRQALHGVPRLTVLADGIELESLSGKQWAKWSSLSDFRLQRTWQPLGPISDDGRTSDMTGEEAVATIVGTAASADILRQGQIVIAPDFSVPLSQIIADLNARRALVAGLAPAAVGIPTG